MHRNYPKGRGHEVSLFWVNVSQKMKLKSGAEREEGSGKRQERKGGRNKGTEAWPK